MASEFLIPHPNIPTADIGLPKLKEVTVKNNENFLALDRLLREFNSGMSALDGKIGAMAHEHPYAPEVHQHELADVNGLIAALDMKAPSVHTHPQYLTEIPLHVHTEAEVDGLLADLASKASIQHIHNIGDVNGLDSELNGKASNKYVLWLESKMAKLTDDETPLVDGGSGGEGVVGTSDKAARADHQHPVNKTDSADKLVCDGNGTGGNPQIGTLYSYALTDHSHPLNYPEEKPIGLIPDGTDSSDKKNFSGRFGDTNRYSDLGHSHALNVDVGDIDPTTVVDKENVSRGSSSYYARADHVHKLPELVASDVKYGDNSDVGTSLDDHEERIKSLEDEDPDNFVKSVAGVGPDSSGNVEQSELVSALHGTTSGTLADGDHTHTHDKIDDFDDSVRSLIDDELEDYAKKDDFPIDDDYGIPTDENIFQHSHWANQIVVVGGTTERRLDSYFETNNDLDGSQVRLATTGKWVKTNATTGRLEVTDDQPVTTDGTEVEGFLPVYDADGNITNSGLPDASLATDGQVLTADGEGFATWKDGMTVDDTLPTAVLHGADISVDVAGQTYLNQAAAEAVVAALRGTWTRGGTTPAGTKLTVCTGITKNGANSTYYAHFADMYFDKNGCLAKVETARNWYRVI